MDLPADVAAIGWTGRAAPADTPESLAAEARRNGTNVDRGLAARVDALIERTSDPRDLGRLWMTRAVACQGNGDATESAEAARTAVPFLVAADLTGEAAFAAATAAVFLDQCGDIDTAIEFAVDALVMLGEPPSHPPDQPPQLEEVRAALGVAGFFLRRSAFELAIQAARRAFHDGKKVAGASVDALAFSYGYAASEAAHVTGESARRAWLISEIESVIDWLVEDGADCPTNVLLTNTLRGEIRHANGLPSADLDLDADESLYGDVIGDLVAWHRLVRGTSAAFDDRPHDAIKQLDLALPGLEASSDNHCIARALRQRSLAHLRMGDPVSAHTDALDLADRTRRWQIDQVGGMADQLARRADLERSTATLEETAARLADDIDRDAITGVRSRRWLERHLDHLSESLLDGAIVMCDIDRFKAVNDNSGHHVGDAVLREFAEVVNSATGSGTVARFGGEEFVIVLDDVDAETGRRVAERVRVSVEAHDWTRVAADLSLSVSCGVAAGRLTEVRSLLVDADQRLLEAKRLGRNRVIDV
ncbi:MAG: diguanylate cyclase [Ilumatobacter sp.]